MKKPKPIVWRHMPDSKPIGTIGTIVSVDVVRVGRDEQCIVNFRLTPEGYKFISKIKSKPKK